MKLDSYQNLSMHHFFGHKNSIKNSSCLKQGGGVRVGGGSELSLSLISIQYYAAVLGYYCTHGKGQKAFSQSTT